MADKDKQSERRKVDQWYIDEDKLGDGAYCWVEKGIHVETGHAVALKFLKKESKTKGNGAFAKEQQKQIKTEIKALMKIKHDNVMKCYAYNLDAKYPQKNGKIIDVILIVLELAPLGELFDYLYYSKTRMLKENVARSYFQQLMRGLKAIHKEHICHRDLKLQNLLLDKHDRLKITDFGLSFLGTNKALMKTCYVGTKGYQAPELLLNRPFNKGCDLFSCGVILFIMLAGFPPFEEAKAADPWYKCIAQGNYKKFWARHSKAKISKSAKELIQGLLTYQPSERMTIKDVCGSKWFSVCGLEQSDLKTELRKLRHNEVRKNKYNDKGYSIGKSPMIHDVSSSLPMQEKKEKKRSGIVTVSKQ